MDKSPDAFRTISEVAEWLGVQAHVLRFWESKFTQVKPVKRAGGRRYYRPSDMLLLGGIKKLLHDDGFTIKGVQKTLREQSVAHVSSLSQDLCDVTEAAVDASGETSDGDAIIVPFKSTVAHPDPEPASASPIQTPPAPEVLDATVPQDATPPVALPDPAPPAPAPVSAEPPQQAEPMPEPSAPGEKMPILPSFLHRPTRKAEPQTPAELPAEPVVAQIRPNVVEAPDPPDENDLPQMRGPLTELASIDRLTAAQVAEITPLAAELQAWLTRSRGAGAA